MSKVAVIGIVGNSAFLSVDRFHTAQETVEATALHFEYGGKGFNQAVAAARFGAEVSFFAAVGKEDKDKIAELLKKENIKPCLIEKNMPTAFAAILTDQTGSNRVTVYYGASLTRDDMALYRSEIVDADVLLLNNEVSEEVNLEAARIAASAKTKIILNPAPQRETDAGLLDRVTYFTPNEYEAVGLENYDNVIQTLGARGCFVKSENRLIPPTADKPVDTTGAGDTFNGVLAAELALGQPLETAVNSALKAAGKSITKKGVLSAIPFRNEL